MAVSSIICLMDHCRPHHWSLFEPINSEKSPLRVQNQNQKPLSGCTHLRLLLPSYREDSWEVGLWAEKWKKSN